MFSTKVLIGDTILTSPTEDGTTILGGHPGADPGFSLGGGALVSFSTSTPINHIVFLQNKTAGHLREGGVRTPCTLPLDPPLSSEPHEGLAICRAKVVPSFLSYFKTLSIGPTPGIESTTSRSAVKRSTN